MYKKLLDIAHNSGIWDKETHTFLLSPEVYTITEEQKRELEALGIALYDCMLGLSHIETIAANPEFNYRGAWTLCHRVFTAGVPKHYIPLQGNRPKEVTQLLKVDLMVDKDGAFRIAEIDGHNKHGLGYSTLGKRFRDAVRPNAKTLPGIVKVLAEKIRNEGESTLTILYADQDRFYLPEFRIAAEEFAAHGITCHVVREMDAREEDVCRGLFLDLPEMRLKPELYKTLIPAYKKNEVRFIIAPKPFLGAKSVLALLRNDAENKELEALLSTFIKKESLKRVREAIPKTYIVGKQGVNKKTAEDLLLQGRFVLKESISSGMKGTVFSDMPDFAETLEIASNTDCNWILQSEVENMPQHFSWYESTGATHTLQNANSWYMRVTAQYVGRMLGDVIVTACQDKAVHGGKQCLQLGTVVL